LGPTSRRLLFTAVLLGTCACATSTDTWPGADPARRVRTLIDEGRYEAAESLARRLVAEQRSTVEARDADRLNDSLVEASIRNGRWIDASVRTLAEDLVRRRERLSPPDPAALATSLRNLGELQLQASEFASAADSMQRCVALRDQSAGQNRSVLADDLDLLVQALAQLRRYDEAGAMSARSFAIREQEADQTSAAMARTLTARGDLWLWRGDYPRASADLERALTIRQTVGQRHPETAAVLNLLGRALVLEGQATKSKDVLERAVAVAEATLRPGHPSVALYLRSLAIPLQDLGNLVEARALQERALSIIEQGFAPDSPAIAEQLNDLADTLRFQGEYTAARPLYERALNIYERRLPPGHPYTTTVVFNLAMLNAQLGDLIQARALHQRAVAAWQKTFGSNHANVGLALWEFGQTLAEQGFDREALPNFEKALAIRRQAHGDKTPQVAQTLSSLAYSSANLGQIGRATTLIKEALSIWSEIGGPKSTGFADSLTVYGRVLAENGDYAGAMRAYQDARGVRLPLLGESHPAMAETDIALAGVLAGQDKRQEALSTALHAEDVGRAHLRLLLGNLPERQALGYAARRPRGLDLALSLVSRESGGGPRVLDEVIRGRALVFDEIASRRRPPVDDGNASPALWDALTSARQRLANLVVRGPTESESDRYAALVADAQREKEDAERALADHSAAFRLKLLRADVGLERVRAQVAPGSSLVSFVRYDRSVFDRTGQTAAAGPAAARRVVRRLVPSYLAFVLRSDGSEPAVVPLGPAAPIDALIANWRQAMIDDVTKASSAPRSAPSFRALGISLRQKIWDPLAAHLGDAHRVFIVPDGALNLVPLAALATDRGNYLLEDGPVIHYLSAERDLVSENETVLSRGGLLAVGGPAFDDESSFAALSPVGPGASRASRLSSAYRGASSNCSSFRSWPFEALPGSRTEVEAVAGLWTSLGRNAGLRTLIGADATERAFKQLGSGQRILHIATHGFFLGDECASAVQGTRSVGGLAAAPRPAKSNDSEATSQQRSMPESPLLLSGLALAGANRRAAAGPDEEDGILTAEEVAALNLEGVEWAVLSACETGLGTMAAGEGVLGLRRAFQVAGVRTVIMSLWPVEDSSTRQWMIALYQARLGNHLDTPDAVRQASLALIRDRKAQGLSTHPFYWAAFVAAGDWR